jgi:hypothetical protein
MIGMQQTRIGILAMQMTNHHHRIFLAAAAAAHALNEFTFPKSHSRQVQALHMWVACCSNALLNWLMRIICAGRTSSFTLDRQHAMQCST